ncbi:putative ammecr1 family protein [Diplodia seriata]|uniref:Putative ammecr1 family protein n=1 Tax=Diplodia seriata TaxID=420778 RepID=A0A0G2H0L9_9PEZI|nr:putative ammecr1 family protein [Diplodia seriata]
MASAAHCAYCFESLSASLEKRHPLSLPEVEDLWNEYNADDLDAEDEVDDDDESADDEEDEEMTDAEDMRATTTTLKPSPAISRLAADSPSSGSTNASTSSVQSATSSRSSAPTTASSATSKSTSSRTSFFSNLGRRVRGDHPSGSTPSAASASAEDAYPLFVTWNTLSRSGSKNLRGCIGTFEAQELSDGLRSYALTSAFEDTRFNQIASRELPSLECGVTLLTNFQPAADAMAWELGKHGLRISFTYHGRRYGSTYLPDVAKEQGWTKEETIVSLMRKAGWSGRRDDWRKVDLNVITYEGSKATLAYAEWKEWRDWVEQRAGVAVKALN